MRRLRLMAVTFIFGAGAGLVVGWWAVHWDVFLGCALGAVVSSATTLWLYPPENLLGG